MTVHLVGAGPGDPDLLTVKAARLIAAADVIVYDRLVHPSLLELAGADAELIDVGKVPGAPLGQELISAALIALGRRGLEVVRLKGGDPFVFGRGGEEAAALQQAGVAFDVVPGISSAVAAPMAAGVPVTQRGVAAAFTVVTGHRGPAHGPELDWEALAKVGGTIVVLMGVAQRAEIAAALQHGGLSGATPVMAVRNGTRADQEVVRTSLAGLAELRIEAPATIVIGAVAALELTYAPMAIEAAQR